MAKRRFTFQEMDEATIRQVERIMQILSSVEQNMGISINESDRQAARDAYVALHYLMQAPNRREIITDKEPYQRESSINGD